MNTLPPDNRFQELDALRGLAAIGVVLFHFSLRHDEVERIFSFGATGVDLFFIISGFVIMMSLQKIKRGRDFIINRVARLYPTYWIVVTFTLIAIFVTKNLEPGPGYVIDWSQYLANMSMFQFYMAKQNLDGPYWTLIVEMVFYGTMLLLFYARVLRFAVPIVLAMLLFSMALRQFYWESPVTQDIFLYYPLPSHLPLFLAGIVFYQLYTRQMNKWAGYSIIVICIGGAEMMFGTGGRSITHFEYFLVLLVYNGAFVLFIHNRLRVIVNPVTLFLGKISYALYLIHQFISIGVIIPGLIYLGVSYYAACGVALFAVISLSAIITYYIEIPAGRKIKQLLRSNSLRI